MDLRPLSYGFHQKSSKNPQSRDFEPSLEYIWHLKDPRSTKRVLQSQKHDISISRLGYWDYFGQS